MNISFDLIASQVMLGLNVGVFYAILSLGLSIIFGLLNIINFAHGAIYMLGAFLALMGYSYVGGWIGYPDYHISYWWSLLLVPVVMGMFGMTFERLVLRKLYEVDHIYGLLLTFAVALILQGIFSIYFSVTGTPYDGTPGVLEGVVDLGFMYFPTYRLFTIFIALAVCLVTWYLIEKTHWGALIRAGIENPHLTETFGVNVPLLVTLTFGFGTALAAFAGVLAAPLYSVTPLMGADIIITVFAVVVIGGTGSLVGTIVTGIVLGMIQGLTKAIMPPASEVVIFVIMALVLIVRPAGIFGKE